MNISKTAVICLTALEDTRIWSVSGLGEQHPGPHRRLSLAVQIAMEASRRSTKIHKIVPEDFFSLPEGEVGAT
jgi:hypothetical protein